MTRKEHGPPRPSEVVFEEALSELRKGRIPETMPFVAAYISDAGKERREYMDAITECAFRLSNSNKILRSMVNSLQASLMRALGKKSAETGGSSERDCGELILWLSAKVQTEQENGKQKDAEMLTAALDALLLASASGKGSGQ